jgi:hypothetical protein
MGLIYTDIEIINGEDIALARRHVIGEEEIKRMHLNLLVDTGSYSSAVECDVVSMVEVKFKNRRTICNAMVLPGDSEPLLGAIPLEDMDVLIHPLRQELIVNPEHPYFAQMKVKGNM